MLPLAPAVAGADPPEPLALTAPDAPEPAPPTPPEPALEPATVATTPRPAELSESPPVPPAAVAPAEDPAPPVGVSIETLELPCLEHAPKRHSAMLSFADREHTNMWTLLC